MKHNEALRQYRRDGEHRIDCFLGKRDLLATYEQMNIHNEYTKKLRLKVRKKQVEVQNAGQL